MNDLTFPMFWSLIVAVGLPILISVIMDAIRNPKKVREGIEQQLHKLKEDQVKLERRLDENFWKDEARNNLEPLLRETEHIRSALAEVTKFHAKVISQLLDVVQQIKSEGEEKAPTTRKRS